MKKILILYWALNEFKDLPFKHKEEFPYSETLRNHILNTIINSGYSAMLRPNLGDNKDTLVINIDNGRFGQR